MSYTTRTGPRTYDPRTPEPGGYDPWSPANTVNPLAFINVTYRLDYFVKAAAAYSTSADRTTWLNDQRAKMEQSFVQYGTSAQQLMAQGAKLDGKSDIATWLTGIGVAATQIPTVVGQAVGVLMVVMGTVGNALEKRSDLMSAKVLSQTITIMQTEYAQLQTMYAAYGNELNLRKYAPLALFGTAALIILK